MEYVIEFLLDLILEGSMEISSNKKTSKWIRYPLMGIIFLFFGICIAGLFILGMFLLKENTILGYLFVLLSLFMLVGTIIKFKKMYGKKRARK